VSSKFGVYKFLVFHEILVHSLNPAISDYTNREYQPCWVAWWCSKKTSVQLRVRISLKTTNFELTWLDLFFLRKEKWFKLVLREQETKNGQIHGEKYNGSFWSSIIYVLIHIYCSAGRKHLRRKEMLSCNRIASVEVFIWR
jgi:hypothetical protein